jgi:hypothetical protein
MRTLSIREEVIYWSCNDLRKAVAGFGRLLGRPRARKRWWTNVPAKMQPEKASALARGETGRRHAI